MRLLWIIFQLLFASYRVNMEDASVDHREFPKDFLFGVSTSAYQVEGGYKADGKGENIWDYYTNKYPERFNGSTGNVACDSYRKYEEDIDVISKLGVQFYRFSISWSRILPNGYSNDVNEEGIKYYNNIVDLLLKKGIQPMVTMYHWDLPMPLQQLGGWTNPLIVQYFLDYARVLFEHFGDKVKLWITMNRSLIGYGDGEFPPFIKQSGVVEYIANHVMLLAHAEVYRLYDEQFKKEQNGKVGVVLDARWYFTDSKHPYDIEAVERVRQFEMGLFLNPLHEGDYSEVVKKRVKYRSSLEGYRKSRLPEFTVEEVKRVQGSYDFLGLNIYTSFLVKDAEDAGKLVTSFANDRKAILYQDESWDKSDVTGWLKVTPGCARKVLKWVKDSYGGAIHGRGKGDPEIIITENGFSDSDKNIDPDTGHVNDLKRVQYLKLYLSSILKARLDDGVNVIGYSVWSLLDNFEWISGYSERFGLISVNFTDPNRKRTPKKSYQWYQTLTKNRALSSDKEEL